MGRVLLEQEPQRTQSRDTEFLYLFRVVGG